ncbi:MAG: fumarate hydratase, partial [Candidatus Omnitrophica bacterium]|nr:fumarate hydratase [Candidatus Omnitrophota bacterium]
MKRIKEEKIMQVISDLCIQANTILRSDVLRALRNSLGKERNKRSKKFLSAIIRNAYIARKERLAICQDTGLVCVFVEIGQDIKIIGNLKRAINKGIELGYRRGFLRNSIVRDPLLRDSPEYQPAVIHIDIVKGNK